MKNHFTWSVRALGQGTLFLFAGVLFFSGCKKQEEEKKPDPVLPTVYADRAHDKTYIASLAANREQQAKDARTSIALSLQMTQCVTRVRATLPPEATAETVQKALESDQMWKELDSRLKQAEAASAETLKKAQELVRKRMQDEMRDHKAIEQGKAKALDRAQPSLPAEK